MYIKRVVKQNAGSNKKYQYLHLVESVRTKKGPRQRLILNLGNLDIPKEKYKELVNLVPMGRLGETDDLVGAIIFLSSDASNYVTGQTIYIEGGRMSD